MTAGRPWTSTLKPYPFANNPYDNHKAAVGAIAKPYVAAAAAAELLAKYVIAINHQ